MILLNTKYHSYVAVSFFSHFTLLKSVISSFGMFVAIHLLKEEFKLEALNSSWLSASLWVQMAWETLVTHWHQVPLTEVLNDLCDSVRATVSLLKHYQLVSCIHITWQCMGNAGAGVLSKPTQDQNLHWNKMPCELQAYYTWKVETYFWKDY